MKRAFTNYAVDAAIGSAFLVATVSSIVFLLPNDWITITSSGTTSLLGVDMSTWSALHKWSGLVMIGGVLVHALLHTGWIVNMTRRVFGRRADARGRALASAAAADPSCARAAAAAASVGAAAPATRSGAATPSEATTVIGLPQMSTDRDTRVSAERGGSPSRAETRQSQNDGEQPRKYSRKAFLGVVTGVVAGAALAGIALRGDDDRAPADVQEYGQADQESFGDTAAGASDGQSGPAPQTQGAGSSDAGGTTGQSSAAQSTRVVIDGGRCSGCGHCLQACPQGVFSLDGHGTVVASSPDACALCGRCLQVCGQQAITLNV